MATGWYDVTCERGAYDTSDAYTQLQKDLPDGIQEDKSALS